MIRDHVIMAAVFVTLGLIGVAMSAQQAHAIPTPPPGPNVTIAGPLPLPVTGSLNVTGTTTVSGSVGVSNPATDPVLVRDVDRSTATPFNATVSCPNKNASACSGSYNVPANQRLTIEYASAECFFGADTTLWRAEIETKVNSMVADYALNLHDHIGTWMGDVENSIRTQGVGIGQVVRIYADPGTTILVFGQAQPSDGQPVECNFTLSGTATTLP
jgi:hypothetical protein